MKTRSFIPLVLATAAVTLLIDPAPRAALAAGSQRGVVSFDVHKLEEENVEGPNVVRSYFTVGDRWMIFGVPKGCRLTADGEFMLVPTDPGVDGEIHVRRSPFPSELDLTDNAAKYGNAVSGQIPEGAQDIEVQPPQVDPYPFNGWHSLGFTCTYTFYGRSFCRTVSYINLDEGVQVVVTGESSPASAEKIGKMAHSFIGSWWTMKPVSGK